MITRYLILKGYDRKKKQYYPKKFDEINIEIDNKYQYIEQEIIKKINDFNPKLNIKEIRYYDDKIKEKYPNFEDNITCGAIIEEKDIEDFEIEFYSSKKYYVDEKKLLASRIIEYVYILPTRQDSRNGYVSQTVFPSLINYMERFMDSPSCAIADHRFMLLNIDKKTISANSILGPLSSFIYAGMDYVEVFTKSIEYDKNTDLCHYIDKYCSGSYDNDYYYIDINNKEVKLKRKKLDSGIELSNKKEEFKGSSEKFYWQEVLPISIIAFYAGYHVNYSEYEDFCNDHKNKIKGKKMHRCLVLLNYLKKIFNRVVENMQEQLILFGAPGTGKSHILKERLKSVDKNKIFRVTIHPEYQYSDFVGQILPQTTGTTINFKFVPGPFTDALAEAYSERSEDVYLVLEELSRGNVAAIFGDTFQLLDRNDNFESKYPIRNKDIASTLTTLPGDQIKLPSNFNIICTMNTNDQNVFPMDTAFKRRFEWEYVSINPAQKSDGTIDKKLNNPFLKIIGKDDKIETNWQSFYTALDEFITNKSDGLGKDEDKQVGQFFIEFEKEIVDNSHSDDSNKKNEAEIKINEKIKNKLLLYLWQDVEETSTYNSTVRLFDDSINSYGDLYVKFGKEKVFSDKFIEDFLKPNVNRYPYR